MRRAAIHAIVIDTGINAGVVLFMEYIYTDEQGNRIPATLERWCWGVVYNDGSEFHQFAPDGTFHRIGEVDQPRVNMFTLYRPDDMSRRDT